MISSELELEHASESVALALSIRSLLGGPHRQDSGRIAEITALIERLDAILLGTPEGHAPPEWRLMLAGLHVLACQTRCLMIAYGGEGDLISERSRFDVLRDAFQGQLNSTTPSPPDSAVNATFQAMKDSEPDKLRGYLMSLPLPTIYWKNREERLFSRDTTDVEGEVTAPIVCVIVFLDNAPLVTPQLLKPDVLYPLQIRVRGLAWPAEALRLHLDLLTTCPAEEFSISRFVLERPQDTNGPEYEDELSGHIKLGAPQSSLFNDLVFSIRAAFEFPSGELQEIPVIGHHVLRLRSVNQDLHPLMSGNRRLDQHVEQLLTTVISECPNVHAELDDLLPILQALTSLLATYAQEAVYKGRSDVSEATFHASVLRDLRLQLGQDVQSHPSQAGGNTDIRYRGVIVELKVERKNGDRAHICRKYAPQAVQYAGVEARQVSVLLVLDLTIKDRPPGDIRNDILLTRVETHGGEDSAKTFPSMTITFVVNGNMKSPSDYST
jgi:hypothetical protein